MRGRDDIFVVAVLIIVIVVMLALLLADEARAQEGCIPTPTPPASPLPPTSPLALPVSALASPERIVVYRDEAQPEGAARPEMALLPMTGSGPAMVPNWVLVAASLCTFTVGVYFGYLIGLVNGGRHR